ncbi:MAG: mechanosensitive ion channel family protein [Spirochaetales bacterium]|nr:mechanosensitive ion channel family protein [Spirochaetales bacterium]
MTKILTSWIKSFGFSDSVSGLILTASLSLIALIVAIAADQITKRALITIISSIVKKTKTKWDDILLEKQVLNRLSHIVPAIIINIFLPIIFSSNPDLTAFLQHCTIAYIIAIATMVILAGLDAANEIYLTFKSSKTRPIKGYIQLIQIFTTIVGVILAITTILQKSPLGLLSGIGAMTAVLLLVFRDTILGLVSSIQIGANDMVRIGDWIEMPKYGADGDVIDVTLQSIKVQNWDKTITTIPIYTLVSDSFKNWRGMQDSGGRRIKRSINIDMRSIKFCDEKDIQKYTRFILLKDYIEQKDKEIEAWNSDQKIDTTELVNGRRMTNIGTFRAYISAYLKSQPNISRDMTFLVRQLQPTADGLPIEIYVFSCDQVWANYEAIQSDIFDHLLASLPLFDLEVFQSPSGADFKRIAASLNREY